MRSFWSQILCRGFVCVESVIPAHGIASGGCPDAPMFMKTKSLKVTQIFLLVTHRAVPFAQQRSSNKHVQFGLWSNTRHSGRPT
jgi:hypothetical protein